MKRYLRLVCSGVLAVLFAAALASELVAPAPYDKQFREDPGSPPSKKFPLGSDELGRDRLSRLLYGARVSLLLAPAAALLATAVAAGIGGAAGWLGGRWDRALMAATDLMMSAPWLFLLITVRAMLPLNTPPLASIGITFALLGCFGWAGAARAVRAGVQAMCRSDFLLQARASGCRGLRLVVVHILPNVRPLLRAQFWIAVPAFIIAEANLSLLGLGVSEPMPSLGNMLRELEQVQLIKSNPLVLAPLALLAVLVLCCRVVFERNEESLS